MRVSRLAGAALLALLTAGGAQADDDLFARETLTGDWGGLRSSLEDGGLFLGGDEILDAFADPSGGRRQGAAFEGRLELFARLDLKTALGWDGALLHANAYLVHGHGLSADDVGNLLTIGNIGATPGTRLFALWLQQSLFGDAVSLRLGQIAADDEFFISAYATLFVNSTFGWPSILGINLPSGGPAYPLATPGLRLKVALTPDLSLSTALLNGDPAPPGAGDPQARDGDGAAFRTDGGAFLIGEIAYATHIAIGSETLPGDLKLGGWFHNGRFADQHVDAAGLSLADPASGPPARHHGDYGIYVIADQLLWRLDDRGDRGLGVFARIGAAPDDRNLIAFHADGGVSYAGPLPDRADDTLGLALSYEGVGGARRALSADQAAADGLPPADYEAALELSYQAVIAPWWIVQPDLQWVLHPGARLARAGPVPGDAAIMGLRTALNF